MATTVKTTAFDSHDMTARNHFGSSLQLTGLLITSCNQPWTSKQKASTRRPRASELNWQAVSQLEGAGSSKLLARSFRYGPAMPSMGPV